MKKAISVLSTILFATAIIGCGNQVISSSSSSISSNSSSETSSSAIVTEYKNPVFEPVMADPCIIRDETDGYYYVYGTEDYGEWGGVARVSYIPIIRSKNLVDWEYVGEVFTEKTKPTWGKYNSGLWAPDIYKIDGVYNLYYSFSTWGDSNPGIGVATSPTPSGPWTDHGMILNSETSGVKNSIDQFVFEYEGKMYMMWGSFRGLYVTELTSDGLKLKEAATFTLVGGLAQSSKFEAPYMIQRGEFYYLFISLGHCCMGIESTYYVNVLRAKSPLGPFVDSLGRKLLGQETNGELVIKGSSEITGPGHNSVTLDDNGDYWIVYHGYDTDYILGSYGSSPRRSLLIDKLQWTEDGWPYVKNYGGSKDFTEAPYIDYSKYPS